MSKNQLVRLALPMSIIIASIILYMGLTAQYRGCVNGYLLSGKAMGSMTTDTEVALAQLTCGKP